MQESMLYELLKLWAEGPESGCAPSTGSDIFSAKLAVLFGKIRFQYCSPDEVADILSDPWLMEVFLLADPKILYQSLAHN